MSLADLIKIGFFNLWQTKLRSTLTILGVVIGIGALSSMISFGTGIQKNITDAFKNNDLFTSMNITPINIDLEDLQGPPSAESVRNAFEGKRIPLNDSLLVEIKEMDGVEIAHPEVIIPCKLGISEKETSTRVQALPVEIGKYRPYNQLLSGSFITGDTSHQIVMKWETLRNMGYILPDEDQPYRLTRSDSVKERRMIPVDSLIGKHIYLITATVDISKAMRNPFAILSGGGEEIFSEDTTIFSIVGILKRSGPFSTNNLKGGAIIPSGIAKSIPTLGFYNIWDILDREEDESQYSSIYVRVDDIRNMDPVKEKLRGKGLHVFSISDQLEEIKQGFLIMDSILGAIGAVALLIAALGIINTMIMSILERTREIGIMKAIGGSDREIKTIFFVEAGAIGFIGSIFGLILGWLFTKVANFVINNYVIPDNEISVSLFYFPAWLIFGAIAFSILISLAAGLYPAIRAARIDPVKALRHD